MKKTSKGTKAEKINVMHFRNCRGINTLTGPEVYLLDLFDTINLKRFNIILSCVIDPRNNNVFIEELRKRDIHFETINIKNKFAITDFIHLIKTV